MRMKEHYYQTLTEKHENLLKAAEANNFREYPNRGYSISLFTGLVYHDVGNRSTKVGEVLKNGLVIWYADGQICGYVTKDNKLHFCKALTGWQYGRIKQ